VLTGDLFHDFHCFSIVLSSVVLLYYWSVRKDRQSVVPRVARGIRTLNAVLNLSATQ